MRKSAGMDARSLLFVFTLFFSLNTFASDLSTRPFLFGDWGGARSSLIKQGLSFTVSYGSETAHNFSGGSKEMTAYTDQWVFGSGLDTEKMGLWQGGYFQLMITDRNGENLNDTAAIGNNMLTQEVYGRGQTWHLTQFWYSQKLFERALEWKIGRMTVGEDFGSFSCDFQNLSFCGAQPGNIVGSYWLNWPTSVWATRFKFHAGDEFSYQIGAYQVNPLYVDDSYARERGLNPEIPGGTTGALIPLEFVYQPKNPERAASYKFGIWYNTAKGNDLALDVHHAQRGTTNLDPLQHNGQYGGYISFVQQLTGTLIEPGFFVFLNISQADVQTAATDRQISLGTQYHGPFGRHDDTVGLGVACTDNNKRYAEYVRAKNARTGQNQIAGSGCEYDSELYYSYMPLTSLFLRPNLQYVLHPGGTTENHDAFVVGLKTGVAF